VSVLGAEVELTRVHLSDIDAIGVYVGDGSALLEDVTIEDIHEIHDPVQGTFIADAVLVEGGTLEGRRLSIGEARVVGIAVGAGQATIEDVVIHGPAAAEAIPGQGVAVGNDAGEPCHVDAIRLAVEAAHDVGVFVAGRTSTMTAADLTVLGTRSRSDGATGRGLQVQDGATLEATRVRLAENREVGALVASAGSEMRLLDLTVEDTMPSAAGLAGSGVAALLDGHTSIARFLVTRNALAGLQLARGGTADLVDGEISHNLVGANVQTAPFDLARIRDNVLYRDNGVDLDSEARPVPEAMPP
jgi:hypothetical protein